MMQEGSTMKAEHYLLKAIQLEASGNAIAAVPFYKKAYKLNPEYVSFLIKILSNFYLIFIHFLF